MKPDGAHREPRACAERPARRAFPPAAVDRAPSTPQFAFDLRPGNIRFARFPVLYRNSLCSLPSVIWGHPPRLPPGQAHLQLWVCWTSSAHIFPPPVHSSSTDRKPAYRFGSTVILPWHLWSFFESIKKTPVPTDAGFESSRHPSDYPTSWLHL